MWMRALLVVAVLAGVAPAARANIVTFSGDTTGSPTFSRPYEDLSGLSPFGSNVAYNAVRITVSTAGSYTFETAARFDSFSLLYSPSFNPATPVTNALAANDDLIAPPFRSSGFAAALAPGLDYYFVNTGFSAADFGAFASTIGGPGVVTVAASLSALPAGLFVHSGNTTGGPTFSRPYEDLSGLSPFGSNVNYERFDFTVATTGDYTFLTTGAFDTFSLLYATAFNPSAPVVNAIFADDDLIAPPFTTSGFAGSLVAGTHYSLITTGFSSADFGAFTVMVTGPGAIQTGIVAVVPLPATPALLVAGLSAMIWLARRRRT